MADPFRRKDRPRLKPLQVPGLPRPIEFRDGQLRVGRAGDNDLTLPGEIFPSVSTHHARFSLEGDQVWVEDLGSKNGTLVNGSAIGERTKLASGDSVQFGPIGPRFMVLTSSPLNETVFVDPKHVTGDRESLTATRMQRIKHALGVPEGGFEQMIHRRARRTQLIGVLAVIALASALVLWGRHVFQQSERGRRASEELTRSELEALRESISNEAERMALALDELRQSDQGKGAALVEVRRELELERERLRAAKQELVQRLGKLEEDEGASAESLAAVREELDETRSRLDLFDPVNLAQERLSDVARVRSTVVLIEVTMYLRNTETQRLLYESYLGEPNFEDKGVPFVMESTGSGFCISPEGWILTNAHVVLPDHDDEVVKRLKKLPIEPELDLAIVFSDDSVRHQARLHAYSYEDDEDLALIQIEPFEGMPHLENFSLDVAPKAPGSDVFLFGFPLGHYALQQGETVIASTFRGILSRRVDPYLQVDAGVHPGNSGGPVTDASGNVIGIVVSVQSLPDHSAVYTIGYAIPIEAAAKLWPAVQAADPGEKTSRIQTSAPQDEE